MTLQPLTQTSTHPNSPNLTNLPLAPPLYPDLPTSMPSPHPLYPNHPATMPAPTSCPRPPHHLLPGYALTPCTLTDLPLCLNPLYPNRPTSMPVVCLHPPSILRSCPPRKAWPAS